MHPRDQSNTVFNLAADLVNHTGKHVFITGKAGTGKTTFLKQIVQHARKNTVVVAPTGVAAINAGGATMHSVFQLPFGAFIPVPLTHGSGAVEATDRQRLFRNIRFAATKREMYQEMELLIIDEVSMVRCDMLDAVDTILRHFRRQPSLPFGGVQVVYIGDLFQLPPVIPQPEWELLKEHYESPFFFESKVVKEAPPVYIELKKIYRQNEQVFIDILNRVRNNQPLRSDLDELNKRYDPQFKAPAGEKYITLTTHNRKADVINEVALKELPGKTHQFEATITGEFSEKALPTEQVLQLKEGAQVMLIKNDSGNDRRYYNGKLGIVKQIFKDEIIISFQNEEADLKLEKETWKNLRYTYNKESDAIEEEELGSFQQFPIRLAWAITIHKSQGLTFDRAVIDAGSSFAPGQVYVALSRCRSLEGMVLLSPIWSRSIATDQRILSFAQREADDSDLEALLKVEKDHYQADQLRKAFQWQKIIKALREWKELIVSKKIPDAEAVLQLNGQLLSKAVQQSGIAEKFRVQLDQLLLSGKEDVLLERVNKAVLYFTKAAVEEILLPVQEHIQSLRYVSKVKKYLQEVRTIEPVLFNYLEKLNSLQYRDLLFIHSVFPTVTRVDEESKPKKSKQEKGASGRDSLELFRQGKTVAEIAAIRSLSPTTVETHLAAFVYSGELDIYALLDRSKVDAVMKLIPLTGLSVTTLKQKAPADISYGEIRAIMNHHRFIEENRQPA